VRSAPGAIGTLIVVENDLYRRMPAKLADDLLESAEHVVVLDHLANETTAKADLLLRPAHLQNPKALW